MISKLSKLSRNMKFHFKYQNIKNNELSLENNLSFNDKNIIWSNNKYFASFIKFAKTLQSIEQTRSNNTKIQIMSSYLRSLSEQQRNQTEKIFDFIDGQQKINILQTSLFNHWKKKLDNIQNSIQKDFILKNINQNSDKLAKALCIISYFKQQNKQSKQLTLQQINQNIQKFVNTIGKDSIKTKMEILQNLTLSISNLEVKYFYRILTKNLRIGFKRSLINKSFFYIKDYSFLYKNQQLNRINLIPMLAKPLKDHQDLIQFCIKKKEQIVSDVKYDGQRTIITFERFNNQNQPQIKLKSRRNKSQNQYYQHLVQKIKEYLLSKSQISNIVLDGQIVCVQQQTQNPLPMQYLISKRKKMIYQREKQKLIQQKSLQLDYQNQYIQYIQLQKKSKEIIYIFDVLQYNGHKLYEEKLIERRKLIPKGCQNLKQAQYKIFKYPEQMDKLKEFFKDVVQRKYQGLILKGISDKYNQIGSRIHWGKMKKGTKVLSQGQIGQSLLDLDLIVMGADYGKGKRSNILSSFLLGTMYQGKIYPISKVGSGFKDEDLAQINKKLSSLIITKSHQLYDIPKIVNVDRWFYPEVIFEIMCQQFTRSPLYNFSYKKGYGGISLRFPVFQRIREDKGVSQCTKGQQIFDLIKDL